MTYALAPRVTRVDVVEPHKLAVGFIDGTEQRVDLGPLLEGRFFDALRDPSVFGSVTIDPHGSLIWPNGVSISSWKLHDWSTEGPQLVETVRKNARQGRRLRLFQRSMVVAIVLWNAAQWLGWFGLERQSPRDLLMSGSMIGIVISQLVQERSTVLSFVLLAVSIALLVWNVTIR